MGIPDARVRITVSAGPGLPDAEPHRLITARPADPPATEAYAEGIRAVVEPLPHGLGPVAGHKVTSYASYVLARRSAVARGAGEALLVDPEGRVVEGAFSNLFAVVDGEVITPPLAQGPLPGVTRQVVLELLAEMAPACRQETVTVTTLREAAELFVTSSVAEVLPVTRLGDQPVGDGRPGPVTRQVQQAYQDCVRRETRRRSDT